MKIIKLFFVFFFFLQTTTFMCPVKDRFACVKGCCLWSFLFRAQTQPKNNEVELTERFHVSDSRPKLIIDTQLLPESEVTRQGTPRHYIQPDANPIVFDQSALSSPSHASTQPMRSADSLLVLPVPPNSEIIQRKDPLSFGGSPGSTKSADSTFDALQTSSAQFRHADSDDTKKGWDMIDDPDLLNDPDL